MQRRSTSLSITSDTVVCDTASAAAQRRGAGRLTLRILRVDQGRREVVKTGRGSCDAQVVRASMGQSLCGTSYDLLTVQPSTSTIMPTAPRHVRAKVVAG
eukprot:scaffold853_cov386-Prasinococcus_capsulatus_cf.AAC.16